LTKLDNAAVTTEERSGIESTEGGQTSAQQVARSNSALR